MTKVLVTGGSGFLGKNLKKANPEWVYLSSSDCNLLSRQEVEQTLSFYKPESVLHLAGIVGGIKENSLKQGEFFYKNVCMNTNILEAARQMKIQRVLSCLSTCAFPDVVDEYPFSEESIFDGPPAKTNFSYGYAKRMLHVQSQAYRKQYGLNYSTFCPSNLYGPEDCYDENKSHFVPALIRKIHDAKDGDSVEFWGTGKPLRQQLYVKDLVEIIPKLINLHNSFEPLLVTPNENLSIHDMIFLAKSITNKNIKVEYNNELEGQHRKDGSNKKMTELIGDYDFTSFREGFKETYDWYTKKQ